MLGRLFLAAPLLLAATGCMPSKNYGRIVPMGPAEQAAYDCDRLNDEKAKVDSFLAHVRTEAQFDYRTLANVLYPYNFGISNIVERHYAEKYADERLAQINANLKSGACARIAALHFEELGPAPIQVKLELAGGQKAAPAHNGLLQEKAARKQPEPKHQAAKHEPPNQEGQQPPPALKAFSIPEAALAPPLDGKRTR